MPTGPRNAHHAMKRGPRAHFYDPAKAQFTDFDAFWEFVSGPLNAGTFGRITSLAGTPPNGVYGTMRIMQFGVKYDF